MFLKELLKLEQMAVESGNVELYRILSQKGVVPNTPKEVMNYCGNGCQYLDYS
jgi:hypothetical protein